MPRPLLFDTTALVAAMRDPSRLPALHRAARSSRSYLSSVSVAELHAGARSPEQAALIERLVAPVPAEWSAAGRLIARAIRRWGAMEPRDHLPDALIAQVAGRIGAAVITDNVEDLRRWIALGRLDATVPDPATRPPPKTGA